MVPGVKPGRSLTTRLVMEMHGVLIFQWFGVRTCTVPDTQIK